jgi:hypothetical protein
MNISSNDVYQQFKNQYKTFDIDTWKFNKSPLKNLLKIQKQFGPIFFIQTPKFTIPASIKMNKQNYKNNIKIYGSIEFHSFFSTPGYVLLNDSGYLPFSLQFNDYNDDVKNDFHTAYIANIHKKYDISGSNMVEFVINLLKKLGFKKAELMDAASVNCNKNN